MKIDLYRSLYLSQNQNQNQNKYLRKNKNKNPNEISNTKHYLI